MDKKPTGKIILRTPLICECYIEIDGFYKLLKAFKKTQTVELPYGKHFINVGIGYYESLDSSQKHCSYTWAWEHAKAFDINEKNIEIELKRKWHLLKHVTAEAQIKSQ